MEVFTSRHRIMYSTKRLESSSNADETGDIRYKLPGAGHSEGGPGSDYVAYEFVFLYSIIVFRFYRLTLSDQAQVTLQLTVSLYDLV